MVIQAEKETLLKILPILNSRLMTWWFIQSYDKLQRKTFPQFKVSELKVFPFPKKKEGLKRLAEKAKTMIKLRISLSQIEDSFSKLVLMELKIPAGVRFVADLVNHTQYDFVQSLEKKIKSPKLTLSQKSEWMRHFETEKNKAITLKTGMDHLNAEIDQMVYALYGLTEDEIAVVESEI
jgi:hypothetical protein